MGILEISPAAREELTALAAHPENQGKGIRIFVEGPPSGEKTCWILFEEKPRAVDRVFIEGELTIIVGPESAWYLKGKELDYDEEDGAGSFYITPIPSIECDCYDEEEWAHLDELPAEEEPWDDDEWELVAEDGDEEIEPHPRRRSEEESRTHNPGRLPRGWRPAP
jgi:Fe-S cluster assembly iron-binding protein IscA